MPKGVLPTGGFGPTQNVPLGCFQVEVGILHGYGEVVIMRDKELPCYRSVFRRSSFKEGNLYDAISSVIFSGIEKENGVTSLSETRGKRSTSGA